jgi:dUTP pyrophosphatase
MTEIITVPVQRDDYTAVTPAFAKHGDAGSDLTAVEGCILAPGQREMFRTGIRVAIPHGYVGYIKPRSGLAVRHGIDVLGGVIDSGYRGEIAVVLINLGQEDYEVDPGDRIAQLVIQPVVDVRFDEVPFVDETIRGAAGFGSTGVN